MTTRWTLTMDCAHPAELARFWALALGYVEREPPPGFDSWEAWLRHYEVPENEWDDGAALEDPDGVLPNLTFLKVPDGTPHKDVHAPRAADGRHRRSYVRWSRGVSA